MTDEQDGPSPALVALIAVATGAMVANLYYAQPLIAEIGPEIGVSPNLAGSIVSVTQIGYGIGLLFLVSLADLIESRKLVFTTLALSVASLAGAALFTAAAPFFVASFVIGVSAAGAQVLVPFVAQMTPPATRGRLVGNVMSGLLTGIMLARPVSLFIAAGFGWRAVFWTSAVVMLAIAAALARMMPRYQPRGGMSYGRILASMAGLVRDLPFLRWRSAYQALLFGAFSMFWTAAPLVLATHFGLGQRGIGLFALAGAGGALAAPFAGRLADSGYTNVLTAVAMIAAAIAFWLTTWAVAATALVGLVILAVVLDAAVQANQVVSQRIIFTAPAEVRGRVNALYITLMFIGGALGSFFATATYHWGGWNVTATAGGCAGLLALILFAVESRLDRRSR